MADSTIFTGSSRYSTDFQAVVDRSIAIASLPTRQLETERAALQAKSALLTGLGQKVDSFARAVETLGTAVQPNRSASSSESSVATARATSAARAGVWRLDVVDVGSRSSSLSRASGIQDPAKQGLSQAASLTLTVGGVSHTLQPKDTSLNSLVDSIEAVKDLDVTAVLVNVGSSSTPDYRLSVQNEKLGPVAISLNDGTELLDPLATGTAARYRVAGLPDEISSDTRDVTLAPGLTARLEGVGTATITATSSTDGLRRALSGFTAAYNSVLDEMDKQRGEKAGALGGESAVLAIAQSVRRLSSYVGSGPVSDLTALGIGFTEQGRLEVKEDVLAEALRTSPSAVAAFLGDQDEGFLGAAQREVKSLTNAETGVLPSTARSFQESITRQDKLLAESEERISRLRQSLTAQIAASDALIASLEQQVRYISGLFSLSQKE
jgi:flagellar hook-associated protein 2